MSKNQSLRTFQTTKNSILIAYRSAFATAAAGKRDKIEPICSPKTYVERTPKYRSLASRGIVKIAGNECSSTPILESCSGKHSRHIPLVRGHLCGAVQSH